MIFVDTAAFYALLDDRDPNYEVARRAFESFRSDKEELLTHEYVVLETVALVQRRLGVDPLRRFVDDLLPVAAIAWVDEGLHREARQALLAAGDRSLSLVDWTSFLVMRRVGTRRAFTFDADFATQGFEVVPGR